MKVLIEPIGKEALNEMASKMFGNLVKAVVDIEREAVAIDAELHVDLAELLVEQGSTNQNLWGVNIYPNGEGDDWLEFDSMINLKPNFGNRSRGIDDAIIRENVTTVLKKFVVL